MDERPLTPPGSATGPSVGFTLSQLGFATSRRFGQLMDTLGLEPRHYALLRVVRASDGQSQQALAERLHIPASTMVSLVDHLQSRGLLERRPHPTDRRTRLLYLTSQGTAVLGEALQLSAQWEEQICTGLSARQREQLLTLLQVVADNVGVSPGELPDRGTGQRPQPIAGAAAASRQAG